MKWSWHIITRSHVTDMCKMKMKVSANGTRWYELSLHIICCWNLWCFDCDCVVFPHLSIGTGEESIPMLMFNHSDKADDNNPRSRSTSHPASHATDKPPRHVEISSNPGTPLKVVEIKNSSSPFSLSSG